MADLLSHIPAEIRGPILWATLMPIVLAAAACTALLRLARRGESSPAEPVIAAVGLALPLLVGAGVFGLTEAKWPRFVFVLAAVVLLGVLAASINRRWALAAATIIAAALASAAWMWWGLYFEHSLWLKLVPGATLLALMLGLEPLAQRERGALLPIALVLASASMAAVVVLSGNQNFAIYCASAAAVLVVAAVFAGVSPSFTLAGGALLPVALILTTMPFLAWLYVAGLPRGFIAGFLLAAGAPLMLWPIEMLTTRLPRWGRLLVGLIAVAIPAGFALAIAVSNSDLGAYGY